MPLNGGNTWGWSRFGLVSVLNRGSRITVIISTGQRDRADLANPRRRRAAASVTGDVTVRIGHRVNVPIGIVMELRNLVLKIGIVIEHLLGREVVLVVVATAALRPMAGAQVSISKG